MSLTISGIGTALPPHRAAQADYANFVQSICCTTEEQSQMLQLLYRRSGVATRHSVLFESAEGTVAQRQSFFPMEQGTQSRSPTTSERMARYQVEAPPLAVQAARQAVAASGLETRDITHVITVSCTGFMAPGLELALIDDLPLSPTVARTHVGFMGCHGALNGLRVARAFAEADPRARILLCAVELSTLHFQYGWDREQAVAHALFADGAAAVVGTPELQETGHKSWNLVASGSLLMPDSAGDMTWTIGDHGFAMTLSPRVPDLIGRHVRGWLEEWLARHGVRLADVGCWAVHPGGPKILDVFAAAMSLPPTALAVSREVLAECGNMSSPTVLFILDRLRRRHASLPCVSLGFGPGLAVEVALFR